MSTLFKVLLVLLSPLWIPLVVAIVLCVLLWIVIGRLFEYHDFTAICFVGILAGLTVSRAGKEHASAQLSWSYSDVTFDCGLVSAGLLATYLMTSKFAPASAKYTAAFSALACVAYVIAKGIVVQDRTLTSDALAILSLSAVLPVFQWISQLKLWRPARPEQCRYYEDLVIKRTCQTPFIHRKVAGLHTLEFQPAQVERNTAISPMGSSPRPVDSRPVIVFLHGYMSGTAMYMYNFDDFTEKYKVYSVDWLGCGASDRVPFDCPDTPSTENFFVDSLEAWRREMGIERFVSIAHSMGGYLASVYNMRFPQRIEHLVLVSPGGVPTYGFSPDAAPTASPTPRAIPRWLWSIVSFAWDHDVTPGVLMRGLGPLGACFARGAVRRRFSRFILAKPVEKEVLELMGEYFYHNLASDGSGDYALKHIFAPGAKARQPIGERLIAAVKAGTIKTPITFFYGGTHDWMSAGAGKNCASAFKQHGVRSSVHLIEPGGHHLYLESPQKFNATLLAELDATFQDVLPPRGDRVDRVRNINPMYRGVQEADGAGSPNIQPPQSSDKLSEKVIRAVSTME